MDIFSRKLRSKVMSRIRSRGNHTTELRLVGLLRRGNITGWRRGSTLPGRPDFVFHSCRLAVFVDGDFWHGHPKKFRLPQTNVQYWTRKIEGNRQRDRAITALLRTRGWQVLRIWESSLSNENTTLSRIRRATGSSEIHRALKARTRTKDLRC